MVKASSNIGKAFTWHLDYHLKNILFIYCKTREQNTIAKTARQMYDNISTFIFTKIKIKKGITFDKK